MKKPSIAWPVFQTIGMLFGLALHSINKDKISGAILFALLIFGIWLAYAYEIRNFYLHEYLCRKYKKAIKEQSA